jgi:hypothetical protein
MEAHNFRCENCDDGEKTLNVHHGYYEKDKMPWEYENEMLRCLCENCHKERHFWESVLKKVLASCKGKDFKAAVERILDFLDERLSHG